ncbi:MAG TPA: S41 family peptidase [Flavisolibacter sp.]|nr:S41 family peptidase [Flavisolibacter sp.]
MQLSKHHWLWIALISFSSLTACKKDNDEAPAPEPSLPISGSEAEKLKDTALLYSKDIYLWYKQIPSSFNARSYDDLNEIMEGIRQYSSEPGFSGPVDRWSFAVDQNQWDNVSSGVGGDFGINVFFREEGDLRVSYVEKNAPAGRAGIHRGWKILKLNGNTNITTGNADFIIDAIYGSNSTSFTLQKPDNSTVDITLNAGSYQENPIHLDSIYTAGSSKVGYMVFNSFLGDTIAVYNEFAKVFNRFASAGVKEVIIDLRYNGGGYVTVQQKLANYLAPAAANGNLMMKQEFNDKYTRFNSADNFKKLGNLNINRIFFIVSRSTASASELLINNLKPYMDVKVVGPSATYGKPVGYFPIEVGSWYIFPVSFKSTNKAGEGNYYNGIPLTHRAADGLDKDWGDIGEASLSSILTYIRTGAFGRQTASTIDANVDNVRIVEGNKTLDKGTFKGMIDVRGLN